MRKARLISARPFFRNTQFARVYCYKFDLENRYPDRSEIGGKITLKSLIIGR